MRALVVEDSTAIAIAEAGALSEAGYEVRTAANGAEALDMASEFHPDVVIMDFELPDMDGLTIFRNLRAGHCTAPVIMVTSRGGEKLAVQALKLGIKDYIVKAQDTLDKLVVSVHSAVEEERIRQEMEANERELRQSEATARVLLDALGEPTLLVDRSGKIRSANKSARECYRIDIGQPIEALAARANESERDALRQLAVSVQNQIQATVQLDVDGRRLELSGWPVFEESGKVQLFGLQIRDITDQWQTDSALRKARDELEAKVVERTVELTRANDLLRDEIVERNLAEQKLRASERLLQTVFDTIPHPIVVKDEIGRYLMVNNSWLLLHGLSPAEVLGKHMSKIPGLDPEVVARFLEHEQILLSGEKMHVFFETDLTTVGGEQRHFQVIKSIFRNEGGEIGGLVGVQVDLTPEREARRNADIAHARLHAAVENLPAGFLLFDSRDRLVMWNTRLRDLTPDLYLSLREGASFEEVMRDALPYYDISEGEGEALFQKSMAQVGQTARSIELRMKNGRWLQLSDQRTSDGGIVSLRCDITELKNREHELRHSQKMEALGQLTGGVAHDFNNLLQVIGGYVELAAGDVGPNPALAGYLKLTQDAIGRAANLVRQLLSYSRKQVLRLESLDLAAVTRESEKLIGRLLPANVKFEVQGDKLADPVVADRGMIEQILVNLSVNARDAMPAGGNIVVEVRAAAFDDNFCEFNNWAKPGKYAALRFSDSGIGMTAEVLERIFEPFFTTKTLGKGTGLGLSTVYGIVQQHQGLIHVESKIGVGTSIQICFPIILSYDADPIESPAEAAEGGSETILVAEDDGTVRNLLVASLKSAGYSVLETSNGEEAQALLLKKSIQIDLVVLDMIMPKLGGRQVFLIMQEARPDLRVLFCSAWYSQEDQEFLTEHGHAFIQKPWSRGNLLRAVHQALEKH